MSNRQGKQPLTKNQIAEILTVNMSTAVVVSQAAGKDSVEDIEQAMKAAVDLALEYLEREYGQAGIVEAVYNS